MKQEKVIISCALTGAWPTKKDTPAIPITPEEIAVSAYEAYQAGASIVHVHVRDDDGKAVMDPPKFIKVYDLIRERCDVLINLTTSGDLVSSDEVRMQHVLEIKPPFASFDCGSFNWGDSGLFLNSPQFLMKLAEVMRDNNVKPEIEVMDSNMLYNAVRYMDKGLISKPPYFQFCLGVSGGTAATIENLMHLRSLLPEGAIWSAFGIGSAHMPIMMASIALGGNVRVGLEDNIYYSKGRLAKSNVELVERASTVAEASQRGVATVDDARRILGIS
ncbi:3-keto-5-aminohexanoate cleavage enzyme [bioreactor metagenome]|uniref:3-keto-5-aminohexanoate cleavage enzyme n=1 Tax=bioreactor metagenome TaxID=1076179 RepID=A0A645ANU7_9ZZZZ